MVDATSSCSLFADCPLPDATDATVINDRCAIRTELGRRVVVVDGIPLMHFVEGDRGAEAYAMVTLVDRGWADQNDVARAFGCSARTLRRHQDRFADGGLAALGRCGGYPSGRSRVPASRSREVERLKGEGTSNREIARLLGITENAVRKQLRRLGWTSNSKEEAELPFDTKPAHPNLSASRTTRFEMGRSASVVSTSATPSEAHGAPVHSGSASSEDPAQLSLSFDPDPSDRRIDRVLAYLGCLDDAAPIFRSERRVPRAGVLLALPSLVGSGILECARDVYGSIGPAFYGLRTSIVAMLLMALLRIKRPEALKEHEPGNLGRILGLDRAPEVKTLRRKLSRLAAFGGAARLGRELAERRVALRGAAFGFLYVDGHVRVYHGKREIPYAHVARMRLAMPATTDYWVNDVAGEPLFVVTAEANAGMVKMLPPILKEVRRIVPRRRVTMVFDRGGWSPKLFVKILSMDFAILTYRKGRFRRVPSRCFQQRDAVIDGRRVTYTLADQEIRLLGSKLRLRQVTRLSENGHQTPVLTSRRDLPAIEIAYRMFERWRQENFFKYLREEYALDALADHQAEPADAMREVPNPARVTLDARIRRLRAEIIGLSARLGAAAVGSVEEVHRTMRGFKIAHAPETREIRAALKRHTELEAKRASTPRRVPVHQTTKGPVIQLAAERKHLTNILKMVAYQAESDLLRMVAGLAPVSWTPGKERKMLQKGPRWARSEGDTVPSSSWRQ